MLDVKKIMLNDATKKKGLYESYYFRGNDKEGQFSFWLKHNLLQFKNDDSIYIDSAFIIYDFMGNKSKVLKARKVLAKKDFKQDLWSDFTFNFDNGSFFYVSDKCLRGKIVDTNEEVSWDLTLELSNHPYFHFTPEKFYYIGFPKKKILTKDIDVCFKGEIQVNRESFTGSFKGMNGHNWGFEHAYKYAYANCNEFDGDENCFFDGFSAKIKIAGLQTPYLSCASIKVGEEWFHFNKVLKSYQHKVSEITKTSWKVVFNNETHLLEVEIKGDHTLWITLDYDHPSRKVSKVHNCKHANGIFKIIDKSTGETQHLLTSKRVELESLIPELN